MNITAVWKTDENVGPSVFWWKEINWMETKLMCMNKTFSGCFINLVSLLFVQSFMLLQFLVWDVTQQCGVSPRTLRLVPVRCHGAKHTSCFSKFQQVFSVFPQVN